MIKINLLPTRKKRKKPKPVPGFLVACAVLLVLSAVVSFYLGHFLKGKIKDYDAQKAANAQAINQLQAKITEVKNYESLNKKYDERKKVIEELKKNQSHPVRMLAEISARLTDGVWLQSLNISDTDVTMSGMGYTNEDVVNFVQSLKASPRFSDVYLSGTNRTTVDGAEAFSFNLTMKVKPWNG